MSKQVTAVSLILLGIGAERNGAAFTGAANIYMAQAIDAQRSGILRENKIGTKASCSAATKAILGHLTEAATEALRTPATKGGPTPAMRAAFKAAKGDWDKIGAIVGTGRATTLKNYLSGGKKALGLGVEWTANSHKDLPNPWTEGTSTTDGTTTASKKASAVQAVSVDKKAREVRFTAGRGSKVKLDDVATIVAAISGDAERTALAVAWVKSHGWV